MSQLDWMPVSESYDEADGALMHPHRTIGSPRAHQAPTAPSRRGVRLRPLGCLVLRRCARVSRTRRACRMPTPLAPGATVSTMFAAGAVLEVLGK